MGTVPDAIRHQCDRFDRRMKGKVGTIVTEAVHAGVISDIGAIAAVLAEFNVVDVRASPFEFVIGLPAGLQDFVNMAPIHALKVNRTIDGKFRKVRKNRCQERRELRL